MAQTIQQTISELHDSLSKYIESTYHIRNSKLISARRKLLSKQGVIHQIPFLESTPRYVATKKFGEIEGIPAELIELFELLSTDIADGKKIFFNPPYSHQSEAIYQSLVKKKNLMIMTGTGSGKTESFLLPIIGKLANETIKSRDIFNKHRATRALLLYPMNALVNDQLGRVRTIFSDERFSNFFKKNGARQPTFSRYTSRTPYAGVRTEKKDQTKLKQFESFYVDMERAAADTNHPNHKTAVALKGELFSRGKWPAKPSLSAWYGNSGQQWFNSQTGDFARAVSLPEDSELITRHEAQDLPPDLLITNYSMLSYMLMRPIENNIFDQTRNWLAENKNENFLIILDEAHLYRGASGAEVSLLLRRLRDRLNIPKERFQVICSTASFDDKEKGALEFGADLTGVEASSFVPIIGEKNLRSNEGFGNLEDANKLASINMDQFHDCVDDSEKIGCVSEFLSYRNVAIDDSGVENLLYKALNDFPPMSKLVNVTMGHGLALSDLGGIIFPGVEDRISNAATSNLLAIGSYAKEKPSLPSLLPCRVHNFFRGLPGLWVCLDPNCTEIEEDDRNEICGKMYHQPRSRCNCGSVVMELYTCKNCGSAYARAYTDDYLTPKSVWAMPGARMLMSTGEYDALTPIDIFLENPDGLDDVEPVEIDLITGRVNSVNPGDRTRVLMIRASRIQPNDSVDEGDVAKFIPCCVCGKNESSKKGRKSSYVQDHQTKGDQPFQVLVMKQIQIQPPNPVPPSDFSPLRGRKALIFSDSRQVAARLAPRLQTFSNRDVLRPLVVWGYRRLMTTGLLGPHLNLQDIYLAIMIAAKKMGVRFRIGLASGETLSGSELVDFAYDSEKQDFSDDALFKLFLDFRNLTIPEVLLGDLLTTLTDRFIGLEALAIGSICEKESLRKKIIELPEIPGEIETDEEKLDLARLWLRSWNSGKTRRYFWLSSMPSTWWDRDEEPSIKGKSGEFSVIKKYVLSSSGAKLFATHWTPKLYSIFSEPIAAANFRLKGSELSLNFDSKWVRCTRCVSVHRPVGRKMMCVECGSKVQTLDPDLDSVFNARRGFYRDPVIRAINEPYEQPPSIIAAEHTAQLNAPQSEDIFSKAEMNELLFQDIKLDWKGSGVKEYAIDILSSTTTMEVGIDIGALSAVALRNMPPGRANYQQRAGRAGRRGNSIATVVAFGSSDSHDENFFSHPDEMISGKVVDPRLTLENTEIIQRHIRAYLLQNYHQERLRELDPASSPDLFSVLGTVEGFRSNAPLNRKDFERWIIERESNLRDRIKDWLPKQLSEDENNFLLRNFVKDVLNILDHVLGEVAGDEEGSSSLENDGDIDVEVAPELGEDVSRTKESNKLLDRLLYSGFLPRYGFPTDVAHFYIFDKDGSTKFRPKFLYSPSQSTSVALTQYAPGKDVWVADKRYKSGAIYSVSSNDRFLAWQNRKLYRQCERCGHAQKLDLIEGKKFEVTDCPACKGHSTFGPARFWFTPPGFAHPRDMEPEIKSDDQSELSYASRAKLTVESNADESKWTSITNRLKCIKERQHLLVSNCGPENEGYNYCNKCGRIEAATTKTSESKVLGQHKKPYPDPLSQACDGGSLSRNIFLGTDFITDIALFSIRVDGAIRLAPGVFTTDVALRTVCEALSVAASDLLQIERDEIVAEYRPKVSLAGINGNEVEIFIYDTLPGGAGFSHLLADVGVDLFKRALYLLKNCADGCDSSCYRCLRSFKNKFDHPLLDRYVGAALIEYLLTGETPNYELSKLSGAAKILFEDLSRCGDDSFEYKLYEKVKLDKFGEYEVPIQAISKLNGEVHIIHVTPPLIERQAFDPGVLAMWDKSVVCDYIPVNEALIMHNLPAATNSIRRHLNLI